MEILLIVLALAIVLWAMIAVGVRLKTVRRGDRILERINRR